MWHDKYFYSITLNVQPKSIIINATVQKKIYRTIMIDGDEFEFSQGFTELHTKSYQEILAGRGFRISEARNCIQIVSDIRHSSPIGLKGDYHPLAKLPLAPHPFGWDDMKF